MFRFSEYFKPNGYAKTLENVECSLEMMKSRQKFTHFLWLMPLYVLLNLNFILNVLQRDCSCVTKGGILCCLPLYRMLLWKSQYMRHWNRHIYETRESAPWTQPMVKDWTDAFARHIKLISSNVAGFFVTQHVKQIKLYGLVWVGVIYELKKRIN